MAAVCLSALLEGQGTPSGLAPGAYGPGATLTFDEGDLCLKRDYSNRQLGSGPLTPVLLIYSTWS